MRKATLSLMAVTAVAVLKVTEFDYKGVNKVLY